MKKLLAAVLSVLMLVQLVPAFATDFGDAELASVDFTVDSVYKDAYGVPVDAAVSFTLSEANTLTKEDVTISPSVDFTLSGSDTDYTVKFTDALAYQTQYTVSVKGSEAFKFTTQYEITETYAQGAYTKGDSYTFEKETDDFTAFIDVNNAYNLGGTLSTLNIMDSDKQIGFSIKIYNNKAGADQKIELFYTDVANGKSNAGPANEFYGDAAPTAPKDMNSDHKYLVSVKNNVLYFYWTDTTTGVTKLAKRDLEFSTVDFAEAGFKADTWKITDTGASTFGFGTMADVPVDPVDLTVESVYKDAYGVPVNAVVPFTLSESAALTKADVTVSPSVDFTLSGSDTDYTVKFTDALAYQTQYTVSVKGSEAFKFTTQYEITETYAQGAYTKGDSYTFEKETDDFTAFIDVNNAYNLGGTLSTLNISDSDKQIGFSVKFYNSKSDANGDQKIELFYTDVANGKNNVGPANEWYGDAAPTAPKNMNSDHKYLLSVKNNVLYFYWTDTTTGITKCAKRDLEFSSVDFAEAGFKADTWKITDTGASTFGFGTLSQSAVEPDPEPAVNNVTSKLSDVAGVPVKADIPFTLNDTAALTKDDITVTPAADFTLSGSGKDYVVKFSNDMAYETEYTISVAGQGSVSYTTQYDTASATTYSKNSYSNGGTNTFESAMDEFTIEIDAQPIFDNNAGDVYSSQLKISDSVHGLALRMDMSYKRNGGGSLFLNYSDKDHNDGAFTAATSKVNGKLTGLTNDKKFLITLKDNVLYVFGNAADDKELHATLELDFADGNFKTKGFKADKWTVSNTTWVNFTFAKHEDKVTPPTPPTPSEPGTEMETSISEFDGARGVPVDAKIPLTLSTAAELTKADIKVTPSVDFELTGSGKDYVIDFNGGLAYAEAYTVKVKDEEMNFVTAFNTAVSSISYSKDVDTALDEATPVFTFEINCKAAISAGGTNCGFQLKDTTNNIALSFGFGYSKTGPNTVSVHAVKDGQSISGTVTLLKENTTGVYMLTYSDAMVYIYYVDENGNTKLAKRSADFDKIKFSEYDYRVDTIKMTNTSMVNLGLGYSAAMTVQAEKPAVEKDGKIVLTFSNDITSYPSTVKLTSADGNTVEADVTVDGKTVELTLKEDLDYCTRYTVDTKGFKNKLGMNVQSIQLDTAAADSFYTAADTVYTVGGETVTELKPGSFGLKMKLKAEDVSLYPAPAVAVFLYKEVNGAVTLEKSYVKTLDTFTEGEVKDVTINDAFTVPSGDYRVKVFVLPSLTTPFPVAPVQIID